MSRKRGKTTSRSIAFRIAGRHLLGCGERASPSRSEESNKPVMGRMCLVGKLYPKPAPPWLYLGLEAFTLSINLQRVSAVWSLSVFRGL